MAKKSRIGDLASAKAKTGTILAPPAGSAMHKDPASLPSVTCRQEFLDHMIAMGCEPHCHVCRKPLEVGMELGWTNCDELDATMAVHYDCRGKPFHEEEKPSEADAIAYRRWRALSRSFSAVPPKLNKGSFLSPEDLA